MAHSVSRPEVGSMQHLQRRAEGRSLAVKHRRQGTLQFHALLRPWHPILRSRFRCAIQTWLPWFDGWVKLQAFQKSRIPFLDQMTSVSFSTDWVELEHPPGHNRYGWAVAQAYALSSRAHFDGLSEWNILYISTPEEGFGEFMEKRCFFQSMIMVCFNVFKWDHLDHLFRDKIKIHTWIRLVFQFMVIIVL